LRPGEKLDEALTTSDESIRATDHSHIYQVITPPLRDGKVFFHDVEQLCDIASISNAAISRQLLWGFISEHDANHNVVIMDEAAVLNAAPSFHQGATNGHKLQMATVD
jgi:FlaA1/EpsC-like NDP-sugar epimerase